MNYNQDATPQYGEEPTRSYSSDSLPDEKAQLLEQHLNALRDILKTLQSVDGVRASQQLSSAALTAPTPTRLSILQARVHEHPEDAHAWLELLSIVESSADESKIRETYEAILRAFPSTCSVQIAYLRHMFTSTDTKQVGATKALLNRFLKNSPHVELWKFYLARVSDLHGGNMRRDTIRAAYEFALGHVGHDFDSGDIWRDYIQLLKAGQTVTILDKSQNICAIRKAYQRAIQEPTPVVAVLWKEYKSFETNLNAQLAEKFIADHKELHKRAAVATPELKHWMSLLSTSPAEHFALWLPRPTDFSAEDRNLSARWRQYLKWEESNPIKYGEEDKMHLHARILSASRKAVVQMRFFPEVWFTAYGLVKAISNDQTLSESKRKERKDEALEILQAGMTANPKSFLLSFAYAEALEDANELTKVHEFYQQFIGALRSELDALILEQRDTTVSSSDLSPPTEIIPGATDTATGSSSGTPTPVPSTPSQTSSSNSSFSSQSTNVPPELSPTLKARRSEYGVAWIMYMKFACRAESQRSAMDVFAKARKDRWTPWEVYEAAGLIKYHCGHAPDVARKIFERMLEKFPGEPVPALRYLEFLLSINDEDNARAFFERIVTVLSAESARPLWDCWSSYVYQYGTLQASLDIEKRSAEAFPADPPLKRFAARYQYNRHDPIALNDLGFQYNRSSGTTSSVAPGVETTAEVLQATTSNPRPGASAAGKRSPVGQQSVREPPAKRHKSMGFISTAKARGGGDDAENVVVCPMAIAWFLSVLPESSSYNGPKISVDGLLHVLRNAMIPSSTGIVGQGVLPIPQSGQRHQRSRSMSDSRRKRY